MRVGLHVWVDLMRNVVLADLRTISLTPMVARNQGSYLAHGNLTTGKARKNKSLVSGHQIITKSSANEKVFLDRNVLDNFQLIACQKLNFQPTKH